MPLTHDFSYDNQIAPVLVSLAHSRS